MNSARQIVKQSDADELKSLGYAQELLRDMGGFSNFALSFSIISVLTGAVTLYGHGLIHGGPLVMTVGWPLVTLLTLPIALSLAQLASSFPTAGALYHWSSWLGGRGLGYFTAWLNTVGQFAITASIDVGLGDFLADFAGLAATDRRARLAIYAALLVLHALLNHLGVRLVAVLNQLSTWVHLGGVFAIAGALAFFAPHQPISFLTTRFQAEPGAYLPIFLLGLLQAGWTFTGYDASAHACEETKDPTRNAPWGIVLSVAVSGVAGWILILAVTIALPDLNRAVAAQNPFIYALTASLGARLGTALVAVAMAAMWFCGLASVTSNSRMLYAFARDGGLPFSKQLAKVSPRFQTPHVAIWVSAAGAFVIALWADAYAAMTALSTVALYASYGLPIAAGIFARRSGKWTHRGPWDLGRWSLPINILALLWIGVAIGLFVSPPNQSAGYASLGALLAIALAWFLWMRKRFPGPPASRSLVQQSLAQQRS
jgi:amino acid transporter